LFEIEAVFQDFVDDGGGREVLEEGMTDSVDGDFVTLVERGDFVALDVIFLSEKRGVEMEGGAEAVAIEDFDQFAVVVSAVVKAEGEGAKFAAGKEGEGDGEQVVHE